MLRNHYIFAFAVIYVLVSMLLDKVHFWGKLGLEHPHGYLFQGILFLGILFVLQNLLFQPYLAVLDERDAQTTKKSEAAHQTREETEKLIRKYEEAIKEIRLKAAKEREQIALDAEEKERLQLAQAKSKGQESYAKAVETLGQEVESARKELAESIHPLADEIVSQILTTSWSGVSTGAQMTASRVAKDRT